MKKLGVWLFLSLLTGVLCPAQRLPEGYILQYQQNFSNNKSLLGFRFNRTNTWGLFNLKGDFFLQASEIQGTGPSTSLPQNLAVLNNRIFGDFILEANVMPVYDSTGSGELCLFLGLKDLTRYYCVQLADKCDSVHHGIFVMKNSVITKLTQAGETPVKWKQNAWQKVRLERNIVQRTIRVYLDDMNKPVLLTKDYELVMGYIGFGSWNCQVRFDNIRIWAPTVIPEEIQFFSNMGNEPQN
jgi:hypothetical protein